MSKEDEKDDKVVALPRWRRASRVDALLAHPRAKQLIPALPVQELYYAAREVGLADAHDLVALASEEQVRGIFDFAAWRKDRFQIEPAGEWIELLVDLGPEKLAHAMRALDMELVALYLRRQLKVYDLELETPPAEPEGHFYPTPDRFFLLDILSAGEAGKRIERLIDWLYRADLGVARQVVMTAKWELDSDLEEWAYRWRAGRMADLGFVDYHDALQVYRRLDPGRVAIGENTADWARSGRPAPDEIAPPPRFFAAEGPLRTAIDRLTESERAPLADALLLLGNRVMAADLVDPGDPAAARQVLDGLASHLGLALEYLARGDADRGAQALRTIAPIRLFRLGLSLTLKLHEAARTLQRDGWVTLVPGQFSLLEPALAEPIAALLGPRPLCLAPGEPVPRSFASLAEIARATALLEEAAAIGEIVRGGLGVDPKLLDEDRLTGTTPHRAQITFSTIIATLAANALLDRPASLVPITPRDIMPLRERATHAGALRPEIRTRIERILGERLIERRVERPRWWAAWLDRWTDHLGKALAPRALMSPSGLSSVDGLLMRASGGEA